MTLQQIYNLAIKMGIEADLRGKEAVLNILKKTKEKYEKLNKEKKQEFDKDSLVNPFSDTRILTGAQNQKVKKIMAGIDIDTGELMLAKFLSKHSGKTIDLIISHHPLGPALADLHSVMHLQAQVLHQYGVPINIAEGVMRERISEVARGVSAINHNKAVDSAKLLELNLMCVHTPADNLAAVFLDKKIKNTKIETVGDIVKLLKTIPEYQRASQLKAGPKIFAGASANQAGKIALTEITGGTGGAKEIYEKLAQAGIGTVIGIHMKEENRAEAQKHHINVVIAGHISSDSLGMNLFLDKLENQRIEIIPCSGLIRVKRK